MTERVRLSRQLGEGAMGAVWAGDHLTLETPVAVKFIRNDVVARNPDALRRFEREAKAAAQIKSPHVVQIYDHGVTEDGTPYIVMELLQGRSLSEKLAESGRLELSLATRIVCQVSSALYKAHRNGIVHRDIKPDNIYLVEDEGECLAKVLDFGIAKRTDVGSTTMTAHGAMMGTPLYMSPEQVLSARDVDEQADLWALAVVLYEMLAGRPPFVGDTVGAVMVAITKGAFSPLAQRVPGIPRALDVWFRRAFAGDPQRRFASAREFAAELQRSASEPRPSQRGGGANVPRPASAPELLPRRLPEVPTRHAGGEQCLELSPIAQVHNDFARSSAVRRKEAIGPAIGIARRPGQSPSWPVAGPTALHSGPEEPVVAIGTVLLVALIARDLGPAGMKHGQDLLPSASYLPSLLAAAVLLVLGGWLWRHAAAHARVVQVSAAGLLVLGALLATAAAGLVSAEPGLARAGDWLILAGRLAAAAVPLGFAARGGLLAYEALRSENTSVGMLLALACFAALAAAVQIGIEPMSGILSGSILPSVTPAGE